MLSIVAGDSRIGRILQRLSTSDRVVGWARFPVLEPLLPHERDVVRMEGDVQAKPRDELKALSVRWHGSQGRESSPRTDA